MSVMSVMSVMSEVSERNSVKAKNLNSSN
jgi:hypothetical protein